MAALTGGRGRQNLRSRHKQGQPEAWHIHYPGRPHGPLTSRRAAARTAPAQSSTDPADALRLLGLKKGAEVKEVRQAFRAAARYAHPDVGGDPAAFQQLRHAYGVALAAAEGRPLAAAAAGAAPARPTSQAPSSTPEPSPEPRKPAPTLEDFMQWRREQQPRRAEQQRVRGEARLEASRDRQASASRSGQRRAGTWRARAGGTSPTRACVKRILKEAPHPEAREAWRRELEMEGIPQSHMAAKKKKRAQASPSTATENSRAKPPSADAQVVGHRVVRARVGDVKVPVYQADDGARYYVSPLTSRRVTIPR